MFRSNPVWENAYEMYIAADLWEGLCPPSPVWRNAKKHHIDILSEVATAVTAAAASTVLILSWIHVELGEIGMELVGIGILKILENLGFFWFQLEFTWNWVGLGGIGWTWDFDDFWKSWIFLILAWIHVELDEIKWN